MYRRTFTGVLLFLLAIFENACTQPQQNSPAEARQEAMDQDLMEVSIPQLEQFYRTNKYTVTDVVRWHFARIEKYNPIYRAVQNIDKSGALATASRLDAEPKSASRGLLWVFRSSLNPTPALKASSPPMASKATCFRDTN